MGDTDWFQDVNGLARQTPWAHSLAAAYALWAGLVCLVLLLIGAWWATRYRADAPRGVATAVLTGVATLVALLLNQRLISPAIGRVRPCHALPHVTTLLTCSNDFSMPSDHCVIAGAIAAGLLILGRRVGAVAVFLALALAFTRVYVGVHYVTDTVLGLLIGAAVAVVIVLAFRTPVTALAGRLRRTPLRPLIEAG